MHLADTNIVVVFLQLHTVVRGQQHEERIKAVHVLGEIVKYQLKCPYFKPQKSSHSRNCESLIINYSISSDIHVYTDVTPIMEFTLLGLSFEVHLCIALKQRKIADFEIVVMNYFLSAIAA